MREPIRDMVGPEAGEKIVPIWGLNAEGEPRGTWREIGLPNMWYMMGNLAWARFFSKHVALRKSFFAFRLCGGVPTGADDLILGM